MSKCIRQQSIQALVGPNLKTGQKYCLECMFVFVNEKNLMLSVLDYQAGEGAGIKSATLFVKGKNAYGLIRGEDGIHRLSTNFSF